MANIYAGSCSCGAIKIEVQGDPMFVGTCHCRNCQKATASTYSTNWVIPRSTFKLVSGAPKRYEVIGGSGNTAIRNFCATCGSSLWTEAERMPEIYVVKAGVMDDGALAKFAPSNESFTSRRPDWVKDIRGATQLKEGYQPDK